MATKESIKKEIEKQVKKYCYFQKLYHGDNAYSNEIESYISSLNWQLEKLEEEK